MCGFAFTLDDAQQFGVSRQVGDDIFCLVTMMSLGKEIKAAIDHLHGDGCERLIERFCNAVGEVHKNGIEFRSATPFSEWAEMTMTLQSPGDGGKVHCTGVVISCTGNKHAGYHVSMVLTGLSRQAQARLSTIAYTQLG